MFGMLQSAGSAFAGTKPIGANLAGLSDDSTQWVFVDLMKQSRVWITQEAVPWYPGKPYDTKLIGQAPLDNFGYPLEVPFTIAGVTNPQLVVTIVGNNSYPAGDYKFLADGQGDVSFTGTGVTVVKDAQPAPGSSLSYTVTLAPGHGYITMTVNQSLVTDHLRNMRLVMPGFLSSYQTQPFHPDFLARLKGASTIRYSDYLATNGNTVKAGSLPTHPYNFSQAVPQGGAIEYIAGLSNLVNADAWINIPHAADDAYVTSVATKLFNRLNKNRKVYVEYSNEVWNYQFPQTTWVAQQACNNPLTYVFDAGKNDFGVAGCDSVLSARKYQVLRNAQIWDIFATVFGSEFSTRIVKVFAGQSVNLGVADKVLGHFSDVTLNPKQYKVDVFAVAPYFGTSVANLIWQAGASATVTVDDILQFSENSLVGNSYKVIDDAKAFADAHGVGLVAYEGGQSLAGRLGAENDDVLTQKLIAANRAPRMQTLYEMFFNHWFASVPGGVFCHFSNVVRPSKWGSWGIFEYQNQLLADSPKAKAIVNILAQ